jgi:hypothetical protein
VRYAEGVPARLPSLAAELVGLKPDVTIAGSALGISAAQQVTQTIPLITFTVEDPVALGLAKSLAQLRIQHEDIRVHIEVPGQPIELCDDQLGALQPTSLEGRCQLRAV